MNSLQTFGYKSNVSSDNLSQTKVVVLLVQIDLSHTKNMFAKVMNEPTATQVIESEVWFLIQ